MAWLRAAIEIFQFIKRYRLRQDAERLRQDTLRREEREHQLRMLETLSDLIVKQGKTSNEGLIKLAEAQLANAEILSQWVKSFQVSDPTPVPAQIAHHEEEWEYDQLLAATIAGGRVPPDLKDYPELSLAFALDQAESSADFDREGRD